MTGKVLFAVGLVAALSGVAEAQERLALVIGNGAYAHAPEAVTAERDAEAIANALGEVGWTVVQGTNLGRAQMHSLFAEFETLSAEAEELAIVYSGHALRTDGESYLAPITARAERLTDVMFHGVPLDLVLQLAGRTPGRAVVFLDGAQLDGYEPNDFVEPGLAALEAPEGVLIVSAAAPGEAIQRSPWRDSRFARLIIDRLMSPGDPLLEQLETIEGPIFVTGSAAADFALVPEPETALGGDGMEDEIEQAYWRIATLSGKPEDYEAYLDRFPNSANAKAARAFLNDDDGTPSPEAARAAAENALGLTRTEKRDMQRWLDMLGHNPGGIDGIMGPASRKALRSWQAASQFDQTGYLTRETLAVLKLQGERAEDAARAQAKAEQAARQARDDARWQETGARGTPAGYRAYLEDFPEGARAEEARRALDQLAEAQQDAVTRREKRSFRRAKRQDTAEAYRNYLGAYPEGIYRDEALARLDEIETAERVTAERERYRQIEAGLQLSRQDRLSIEQRLRFLGYNPGDADGQFDARSRQAIGDYQFSRGLPETGYLNRTTVVTLVRETNQAQNQGQVQIDGAQVIRGLLEALGGQQN